MDALVSPLVLIAAQNETSTTSLVSLEYLLSSALT